MKGNFGRKPGRRFRANAPFPCALSYAYFRNFLSPQPASPIKPLPRNIIVAGWKAFAPILAPLSSASPEGDAIEKNNGQEEEEESGRSYVSPSGLRSSWSPPSINKITRSMRLITQSACHVWIRVNNPYITVFKGEFIRHPHLALTGGEKYSHYGNMLVVLLLFIGHTLPYPYERNPAI